MRNACVRSLLFPLSVLFLIACDNNAVPQATTTNVIEHSPALGASFVSRNSDSNQCQDSTVPILAATWEDGGDSPWDATTPARLIDGDLGDYWQGDSSNGRRIQLSLQSDWTISAVRYHDNWGAGDIVLDVDAANNGNEITINTGHYPLDWQQHVVNLGEIDTVYLSVTNNDVKLNELQFCGEPINNSDDDPVSDPEPPGGSCDVIPDVTAAWKNGTNPVDAWRYQDPMLLVDGDASTDWYHYWEDLGTQTAVVFTLPENYDLNAIRWHDYYGAGDAVFSTSDQSKIVTTDKWPLAWHTTAWAISNVATIEMTIESNDTKLTEVRFCGSPSGDEPPDPDDPTDPDPPDNEPDPPTNPDPNGGQDFYAQTVHIVDSFGQIAVPDTSATPWSHISSYYAEYYDGPVHKRSLEGMCSEAIHNSYWVLSDENGPSESARDYDGDGDYETYYPTWHPPVHNEGQDDECFFMHDHGEDPRTSPHYDLDDAVSIGVPFGFVHSKTGNHHHDPRLEDHVGHKVIVQNDYTLVNGRPFNVGTTFDEVGIQCNWLSKVHQGSHSSDALSNNLHEYFLNIECTDGTHARVKELASWGFRNRTFSENCTKGWYWPGFYASGPDHDPNENGHPFNDGKREFACIDDRDYASYQIGPYAGEPQLLMEIWKPDGKISAPQNEGSVLFSPYYITRNSTRYFDYQWTDRFDTTQVNTYLGRRCDGTDTDGVTGNECTSNAQCMVESTSTPPLDGCTGTGGMVSSVDLCVRGTDAWNYTIVPIDNADEQVDYSNAYPGFCTLLDANQRQIWEQQIEQAQGDSLALSNARKYHRNNPFNGTMRGVHQKRVAVYQEGSTSANYDGLKVFCTDAFGENAQWPTIVDGSVDCPVGTIVQAISATNNQWDSLNIDGSSVGAFGWNGDRLSDSNPFDTGLVGGGEVSEWVIDGVAEKSKQVRSPN